MKYFLFVLILLSFMVVSCDDIEENIVPNLNATATFEESIPLAFANFHSIRVDTMLTERVREKLRLARTVDIELQDVVNIMGCPEYHTVEIIFTNPVDSTKFQDSCRTTYYQVDWVLDEYGFFYCSPGAIREEMIGGHGYTFTTTEMLNISELCQLLITQESVTYAGVPPIDCDIWRCSRFTLTILDDVYTFKFYDFCDGETETEWVVDVIDDEATLVVKVEREAG